MLEKMITFIELKLDASQFLASMKQNEAVSKQPNATNTVELFVGSSTGHSKHCRSDFKAAASAK